jgi:spore coat protein U-like protein
MKRLKLTAALVTAALTMGLGAAQGADSHTINVSAAVAGNCKFQTASPSAINLTLDASATTTLNQAGVVVYRCTKDTAPAFVLASGSTGAATGGNLDRSGETIAYTFSSVNQGVGLGMGGAGDRNLTVTVSVDQSLAANVTPGSYTDTIAISVTP